MCEFSVAKTITAVLLSASHSSPSKISCVRSARLVSPHPGGNRLSIARATAHMWDMLSVCWAVYGDTVCCYRAQEFYVAPTVRGVNLISSLRSCCRVLVLERGTKTVPHRIPPPLTPPHSTNPGSSTWPLSGPAGLVLIRLFLWLLGSTWTGSHTRPSSSGSALFIWLTAQSTVHIQQNCIGITLPSLEMF